MEILLTTKVTDIQKVICSLPFSVASRQKFPMDVVLLDQQYRKFNCETFAIGIMKRIDQDALTSDQKNLLKRSVQILLGNAEM
jgi:hypothetical protein